ncbi:MAG: HEAT repeat domain-containing protein [Armatimonadota bacterium]
MTRIAVAAVLAASFLICGCAEDPIPKLSDELEELDLDRRLIAVARLRVLDDDRAIELLAEALESDEELVDAAGEALAEKGRKLRTDDKPDKVNEALTRIMKNSHLEQPPRAKAAWALGEIGDRESIAALKGARSANDAKGVAASDVRTQATQALQKLGYYTRGRAPAMDEDGEVPDRALDGTPDLEQATEPTAMPEPEEATDEETAPAEPAGEST